MSKFEPKKEEKQEKPYALKISEGLNAALDKAAQKTGLKKQALLRQMIKHCLDDMGIEYEE